MRNDDDDFTFRPISQQRRKYFKLFSQLRKQTNSSTLLRPVVRRATTLHRTSPFSTNYYGPFATDPANKSIQVDDFDEFSFKTAIDQIDLPTISISEIVFTSFSFFFFVIVLLYFQLNSRPFVCLFHRSIELNDGFRCDQIEIHFVEIDKVSYQIEIRRNHRSKTCLGFDLLSCLPLNKTSPWPKQSFVRNDFLSNFCRTNLEPISCSNDWFRLQNVSHCSCSKSTNDEKCFRWTLIDRCQWEIPWWNFCLKHSNDRLICHAYLTDK